MAFSSRLVLVAALLFWAAALALALLATTPATVQAQFGEPECIGVCKPTMDVRVHSLEPSRGGVAGGTLLTIHGVGFSEDRYNGNNRVDLAGVNCPVISFVSSPTRLVCRTPPRPAGLPDDRAEVRVTVDNKRIGVCSSGCSFTYSEVRTPILTGVSPSVGTSEDSLRFQGRVFTSSYGGFNSLLVGQSTCAVDDEDEDKSFSLQWNFRSEDGQSTSGWTRDSHSNGGPECSVPPQEAGLYKVSFNVAGDKGDSLQVARSAVHYYRGDRPYNFLHLPVVRGVSSARLSPYGHATVTLQGSGFAQESAKNTVRLGSAPCQIQSQSLTPMSASEAVCKTGTAVHPAGTLVQGPRGILLDYQDGSDPTPLDAFVARTSSSNSILHGFFHPLDDGNSATTTVNHTFVVKTEGSIPNLWITPAPNGVVDPASNATVSILQLANPTSQMASDYFASPAQKSQTVALDKNTMYYIKMEYEPQGGNSDVSLGVIIESDTQRSNSMSERQELSISSVVLREVHRITLPNSFTDQFRIFYAGPVGDEDKDAITGPLSIASTASQVYNELRRGDVKNALGEVTEWGFRLGSISVSKSVGDNFTHFDVQYNSPSEAGVRRLPILARVPGGPALQLPSQYQTGTVVQAPSEPVSGVFSVNVNGDILLDLPFDISPESLELKLEELPSISSVSVSRSGNPLDGATWFVTFDGTPGDVGFVLSISDASGLSGFNVSTSSKKTFSGSLDRFTPDLPGDFLEQPVDAAKAVFVSSNDVSGRCVDNCAISYEEAVAPQVTGVVEQSVSAAGVATLQINGQWDPENLITGNQGPQLSVLVGDSPCTITSTTGTTSLVCETSPGVAGQHAVRVIEASVGSSNPASASYTYQVVVASVSPAEGSTYGGTTLTIQGNGFSSVLAENSVMVGSVACAIKSASGGQIVCVTGSNAGVEATNQDVVVTVNTVNTDTSAGAFAYLTNKTARLYGVTPTSSGGAGVTTTLTIQGEGLTRGSPGDHVVTVGDLPCAVSSVSEDPDNTARDRVLCSVTGGPHGQHTVQLVHANDGFALSHLDGTTDPVVFSFQLEITAASNTEGSTAGGVLLSLIGSTFDAATSKNKVLVGGQDCAVTSASASQVVCRAPPLAAAGSPYDIKLTSGGFEATCSVGGGNGCTYTSSAAKTPTVTAVHDTSNNALDMVLFGQDIVLTGTDFSLVPSEMTVSIGGAADCTVTSVSNNGTSLECTVQGAIVADDLSLQVNRQDWGNADVSAAPLLDYPLRVNSISHSAGSMAGGHLITLTGQGFSDSQDSKPNSVLFGGQELGQCTVTTATSTQQLVCSTPSSATEQNATITVKVQTSFESLTAPVTPEIIHSVTLPALTTYYEYLQALTPTVTSSSLNAGDLTVQGSGFSAVAGDMSVSIHGVDCPVTASSASSVTCTLGSVPAGTYPVVVVNSNVGKASGLVEHTTALTVGSISGASLSGSRAGGSTITVAGTGFSAVEGETSVAVCNAPCTVSSVSFNSLECETGPLFLSLSEVPAAVTLRGTPFGDSSDTSRAFDLDHGSNYLGGLGGHIGLDLGAGSVARVTHLRFFPREDNGNTGRQQLEGAVFEGSTDSSTWTTLATLSNVVPGWNTISRDLPASEFRYLRLRSTATLRMHIADLLFQGLLLSTQADGVCRARVSVNGIAPVESSNQFTYDSSGTPTVSGLSPAEGSAAGGTEVTLTGAGFPAGSTGDVTVTFNGQSCVVTSVTSTQVVCTTAELPLGTSGQSRSDLKVRVAGAGLALVATDATFTYRDLWSATRTWEGGELPVEGDTVVVPSGRTIVLDVSPPKLKLIIVEGALIFDEQDLHLQSEYIVVKDGVLQVGTESAPFQHSARITIHGKRGASELPTYGAKNIMVHNGVLDLHGKDYGPTWTMLDGHALNGTTSITVEEATSWEVGQSIVVAPSGFLHSEFDEAVITAVSNGGKTFELDRPLRHSHWGTIQTISGEAANGNQQYTIDTRAEVGLLSRNVVVEGDEDSIYGQYGVHIMLSGHRDGPTRGRFSNVEVRNAGQAFILGRYPIHYHLLGDVSHSYVKKCSIHHTFNRAVALHGVHYLTVEDNVAFNTMGHTYFVEDGIETHNQLVHNLAVFTEPSFSLLNTDTSPASFWVTNPLNMLRNNAAAGSFNYGFWFKSFQHPEGPSFTTSVCPQGMQLGQFDDNRAHSNGRYGLRIFEFLNPRQKPCEGGSATDNPWIPTEFRRLTSFKNLKDGTTANSVGDLRFIDFRLADNKHFSIQVAIINAPTQPGPQIKGAVIIGYSQNGYLNPPEVIGLRTPRTENFLVDGVTFVNFQQWGAALAACAKCEPSWPTKNQGGYTHHFQNLLFENTPRRIKWNMPKKAIFADLDGSLRATKGSEPGFILPYWPHNHISTCTYDATTQAVFDNGLSCGPSIGFRRVAMDAIQPSFALNWKNMLVTVEGRTSTVGFLDKSNPNMGWVTTVPLTKTVDLKVDNFVDFTQLRLDFNLMQPSDSFQMDFRYTDARDHFEINAGGLVEEAASVAELTSAAPNGKWFQDKDNEVVHVMASGSGTGVGGMLVKGFRCPKDGCPQPLPVVANTTILYWSDPRSWEERYCEDKDLDIVFKCSDASAPAGCTCTKPVAGESVYIPEGHHMYLDESTPLLEELLVDGHLEFDEQAPGVTELNAKRIMVRRGEDSTSSVCILNPQDNKEYCRGFMGAITAGTPTARFGSNSTVTPAPIARIHLYGNYDDTPLTLASEYDLGPKSLANFGKLSLHGERRAVMWTKLAQTADSGATSLLVEGQVDWRGGDTLVLTPSTADFRDWEQVSVLGSAPEGGNTRVQLSAALTKQFWGEKTPVDCEDSGNPDACVYVDGRVEVGLLNSNVEIVSEPDTLGMDFGCHVYTGKFVRPDASYYGYTQLDNVAIQGCGQKEGTRSALYFENLGNARADRLSYVQSSSFVSSYLAALEIKASSGIRVHNNVLFGSFRSTVRVYADDNIFTDNLALYTQARPSTAAKQVDILATYEMFGANDFVGNVAAGCEGINSEPGHGYLGFSDECSVSRNNLRVRNNVVHSSHMGFLAHYEWSQGCTQINQITAFKNRHIGVFALRKSNFVLRDALLLDNSIGATFVHANIGPDNRFDYENVRVVGARNPGSCTARVGIMVSGFALKEKGMPPKASELPWELVKTDPPVYGVTHLRDITFARFGTNNGACSGDSASHALENNQLSADAAHPMVFRGVRWAEDTDLDYRFFSHFPNPAWRNPTDCGDMDCDGPKHVFWKDADGSLTGLGVNAAVVAHTPGVVDPAVCSLRWQWNAYLCRSFDLQTFVIESKDADTYDRRVAPVAVTTTNADNTERTVYLNGPMDHLWNFEYTSQKRLSTFWTAMEVNKPYKIDMTGTNPKRMKMYLLNAPQEQSVLITLNYTNPQIVRVSDETGAVIQDMYPQVPQLSSPHGANTWLQPPRTLVFNVHGSRHLTLNTINAVFVNVRMQMSLGDFFEQDFVNNVVSILNIDPATVKIASVRSGSVIVEWFIIEQTEDPNWTPAEKQAKSLPVLADNLARHVQSTKTLLPGVIVLDMSLILPTNGTGTAGTTQTIVDSSTTTGSGTTEDGGISVALIVAASVGGTAALVAAIVGISMCVRHKRRRLLQSKVHSMRGVPPGHGGISPRDSQPQHSRNLSEFDGTLFTVSNNHPLAGLHSELSDESINSGAMRADSDTSSMYDSPRPLLPPPVLPTLTMESEDRLQSKLESDQCATMMRASSQATGMTMGRFVAPESVDRPGSVRRHTDVSVNLGSSSGNLTPTEDEDSSFA